MGSSAERIIDMAGLSMIRIVIASYFTAVSLEIIDGVNPAALFLPFLPALPADLAGSALLLFLSLLLMTAICLRMAALSLALFVLSSSLMQNFIAYEVGNLTFFWRDLALISAVILSYASLDRVELRRASTLARLVRAHHGGHSVRPHRITAAQAGQRARRRPVQRHLRAAYLELAEMESNPAPALHPVGAESGRPVAANDA